MKNMDRAIVTYFQPKSRAYEDRKALAKDVRKEVARFIDADIVNLYDREPDKNFNGLVVSVGGDGVFLGSTHSFRNPNNTYILIGAEGKSLSAYAQSNHSSYKEDIKKIIDGNADTLDALRIGAKTNGYETWHCLNDIVVGAGSWGTMFEYSLEIAQGNKKRIFPEGRGTSILFSTPCGSTAYALSAGGPVVDRSLDAIIVVPESPNKSMVANKRISNYHRDLENLITPYVLQPDVRLTLDVKRKSAIVPDGRAIDTYWVEPGTEVRIERRPKAKLVKLK